MTIVKNKRPWKAGRNVYMEKNVPAKLDPGFVKVKSLLGGINKKQEKRQTFQQSRLFILFLNGHLSEASMIDSKYIKMTGLQDF